MPVSAVYDRLKELKEFDDSKLGVKGLSDTGAATIPRIFHHSPELLSGVHNRKTTPSLIPVIDLSHDNVTSKPQILAQIRDAIKSWGFFQVVNHGIPDSVLKRTISAIRSFHEQPREAKWKYYSSDKGRGVMFSCNSDLYRAAAATWHDSLSVHMGPPEKAAQPEEIPEVCRDALLEYGARVKGVADSVMGLLALGLGLDAGRFKELTFADSRVIVGHIYPHCPQPDLTLGTAAHTDIGVITILLREDIRGLQVKRGGEWVDVESVHGGLIVNIGDFLQIASNGEYESVQHRVLANSAKESRITIATFFNVAKWRDSGRYGPLPELLTPEKPAIYRDFTIQEFYENFYSKGLDCKSLVEKLKL